MKTKMTFADLEVAATALAQSETGRQAMTDLLTFLENAGLSLDGNNQLHVLTLLSGAFGSYAGSARDVMRDAFQAHEELREKLRVIRNQEVHA